MSRPDKAEMSAVEVLKGPENGMDSAESGSRVALEVLPGISQAWIDFRRGRTKLEPAWESTASLHPLVDALRKHGRADNLRNAADAPFAVTAVLYPALWGGPLSQLLKALTAVKAAEELTARGFVSIPILRILPDLAAAPFFPHAVALIGAHSELHLSEWPCAGHRSSDSVLALSDSDAVALVSSLRNLGDGRLDPEQLRMIEECVAPGGTLVGITARLFARWLDRWGVMVVVPEESASAPGTTSDSPAVQLEGFPVIAKVLGPEEIEDYAVPNALSDAAERPLLWPQATATLVTARSRRTLTRYGLGMRNLWAGEDAAVARALERLSGSVPDVLERLQTEFRRELPKFGGEADDQFRNRERICGERILFQLGKLRRQCLSAEAAAAQAAVRRIRKACNFLAPRGRLQEQVLGGVQFPLSLSEAGVREVCRRLDIHEVEHQLIDL